MYSIFLVFHMSRNFGLYFGNCVQMLRFQNLLFCLKTIVSFFLAGNFLSWVWTANSCSWEAAQFMKFAFSWATWSLFCTWVFWAPSETWVDGVGGFSSSSSLQQSPTLCSVCNFSAWLSGSLGKKDYRLPMWTVQPLCVLSAACSTGQASEMDASSGNSPSPLLRWGGLPHRL